MLPSSSMPWKPATTAILPCLSASWIFWPSIDLMRARVNAESVTMRTCEPRNDCAVPPAFWMASDTSPTETCSPVAAITSSSRS